MIEADDVELPVAGVANRADVIAWVDAEARGARFEIARPGAVGNADGRTDQHAAALARRLVARMRPHLVQHALDDGDHHASTATAMPMPPPMQSDATP